MEMHNKFSQTISVRRSLLDFHSSFLEKFGKEELNSLNKDINLKLNDENGPKLERLYYLSVEDLTELAPLVLIVFARGFAFYAEELSHWLYPDGIKLMQRSSGNYDFSTMNKQWSRLMNDQWERIPNESGDYIEIDKITLGYDWGWYLEEEDYTSSEEFAVAMYLLGEIPGDRRTKFLDLCLVRYEANKNNTEATKEKEMYLDIKKEMLEE